MMIRELFFLISAIASMALPFVASFTPSTKPLASSKIHPDDGPNDISSSRREWLHTTVSNLAILGSAPMIFPSGAAAKVVTDASSGLLPDLPPDAVKSYLQYRFPLQLAADFYVFDLQTMVADTGEFPKRHFFNTCFWNVVMSVADYFWYSCS